MKKNMKGGNGDLTIILLLCCCCFIVSMVLGGFGYTNKCSDDNNNKDVTLTVDNECFCGFEWCEAGNVCNASGCSPVSSSPPPPPPPPPTPSSNCSG